MKRTVNKEQFEIYEQIRQSGVTNMFNVRVVIDCSGGILEKSDILYIMTNYNYLKNKYMKGGD